MTSNRATVVDEAADGGAVVTRQLLYKSLLALGVWVSFCMFADAQEVLTKSTHGPKQERFHYTWTLLLCSCTLNASFAAAGLLLTGATSLTGRVPQWQWALAGLAQLGSANFALWSLQSPAISYALQVLLKSCKAIPVMFGEVLFERSLKLTTSKVVGVALLSLGVVIFTCSSDGSHGKATQVDSSYLVSGITYITLSLLCDGVYGPYQNKIKSQARARGDTLCAYHNMLNMNLWQTPMCLLAVLCKGEAPQAYHFFVEAPETLLHVLRYCVTLAVGQVFIFQLQSAFGALTVTKVTTVRKLFTALWTGLVRGGITSPVQWLGVATVFLSEPAAKCVGRRLDAGRGVGVGVAPPGEGKRRDAEKGMAEGLVELGAPMAVRETVGPATAAAPGR